MSQKKEIWIIVLVLSFMLCSSTYAATLAFPDIAGHWAEQTIMRFVEKGIIGGYPDGMMRPDESVTRGEFTAMLVRNLELDVAEIKKEQPTFYDINGHWSEKNIEVLVDKGILDPIDYDGSLKPDEPITRIEIIKMMVRTMSRDEAAKEYSGNTDFKDDKAINESDKGYVSIAKEDNLIGGYPDGTIRPDSETTRAEAVGMIDNLNKEKEKMDKDKAPTPTDKKDNNKSDNFGSGSSSRPKAQVTFELPATVHTDTNISIEPTLKYARTLTWSLHKEIAKGESIPVGLGEVIDGSLNKEGGTIVFKESGSYTLTATVVNYGGRETSYSKSITVYPVINVGFALPENTHTDRTVTIETIASELGSLDIVWSAAKDGETVAWDSVIDGSLSNEGGTISFNENGNFEITATVIDVTGRIFTHSESVAVYPVAGVACELPDKAHTDTSINLTTTLSEMEGLTAEWSLIRNGETVSISEYVEGEIANSGGTIRFREKGVYVLIAKVADNTGRVFENMATITVYPVGAVGFYLPEITHTDTAVMVEATFENIDTAKAVWTLTKDGKPIELDNAIEGKLTNDGGSIRFLSKGEYILKAAFTDGAERSYSYTSVVTVYPVPSLTFALPALVHTDTNIPVTTVAKEMNGLTVEWLVDNTYGFQDWATYVDGKLDNNGGNIRFKHAGVYELVARAVDATGRVFLFEHGNKTEVHPVLDIRFELPRATYPDRTIDLRTTGNINVLPVEWNVAKDGKEVKLAEYLDGKLNAQGGKVRFIEYGEYVLTASMTDALGRTFSHSSATTVYPIPEIQLAVPEVSHKGGHVLVTVSGSHLDNLSAGWTIAADDGDALPYTDYANGSLANEGGTITFREKGNYDLTVTFIDTLGGGFKQTASIKIYPIPKAEFILPETTYTDKTIDVDVLPSELGGLNIAWSVIRNGEEMEWDNSIDGVFTNEGGSIRFKNKGAYILKATITDELGRNFEYTKSTTVYPIPKLEMTLPAVTHTDKTIDVHTTLTEFKGLQAVWSLIKNGNAEKLAECIEGTLANEGGAIRFKDKGDYVLKAAVTDELGRSFEYSASTKVYPVPMVTFTLPEYAHTDTPVALSTVTQELGTLGISWTISKDGCSPAAYTSYASGALVNTGGNITFNGKGSYLLAANVKDETGRVFTYGKTITIKPVIQTTITLPKTAHIGTNVTVATNNTELGSLNISWALKKDGNPVQFPTYTTGTLNNSGGTLKFNAEGSYTLITKTTDDTGREFTSQSEISIYNNAPTKPVASANVTRTIKSGKFLVNISASSTDADNDAITYEYTGKAADNYYSPGTHTIKVRAKDEHGAYSPWAEVSFTVVNSAPSTPVITRTPNGNSVPPNTPVKITATSTDPEGDPITYVWENRNAETQTYPLGKNVIRVKAVDAAGAESPWTAIVFFVADSTNGGGMTLTGPESVIVENGLEGATITEYTFTVPPVSGHSGSDYGRVRGYNVKTGKWEQTDYGTTSNGITFSRTLPSGTYSKLEFYYYTNHNCMYNKSNITYSVQYYFE